MCDKNSITTKLLVSWGASNGVINGGECVQLIANCNYDLSTDWLVN